MAVFQGARLRGGALPGNEVAVRPRSSAPPAAWSTPRVRPVGLLIALILGSTMLGLVYLTQTLGSNVTVAELDKLAADANKLNNSLKTQALTVELYLKPRDIATRARAQQLRPLREDVLVLPAP
jgi:hypothetical protein